MIQIKEINALPDWVWSEHSLWELGLAPGDELVKTSVVMYDVGGFAVGGLHYTSLTSPPWLWFLLTEGVARRPLSSIKVMKACLPILPPGTQTPIAEDFAGAVKFAKVMGFERVLDVGFLAGRPYGLYRRD